MLWNESSQEFIVYSPKSSSNPFENVSYNYSYFVFYEKPSTTLGISGASFDNMNISMEYGWNSPNYPYTFTGYIKNYTDSFLDSFRFLLKWNNSAQEFIVYSPKSSSNPFDTISMGEGQFININNPSGALLVYNKTGLT